MMKMKLFLWIVLSFFLMMAFCFGCTRAEADDVTMVEAFPFVEQAGSL